MMKKSMCGQSLLIKDNELLAPIESGLRMDSNDFYHILNWLSSKA